MGCMRLSGWNDATETETGALTMNLIICKDLHEERMQSCDLGENSDPLTLPLFLLSVRLVGRIQGHKTKLSMPRPSYVLHFHLSQSGSYMGGVPNFSRLWYICIYPFSILFTKWLQPICKTQKHAISALDCPNLLRMCGDQEISGCQSQDGVQIL